MGQSAIADNAPCEPIAIIGMGCRWPGESIDSESPSELWDFLESNGRAYSKFPPNRINVEAFYHPTVNRPGSFRTEGGCFLKSDVRKFDHTFFAINPKEAMSLDPAQAKFLEVVYEAFESAGVPLHKLAGSKTGCFVGNLNYDHQLSQLRDAEYPSPYTITGGSVTLLSNRVTYIFDLKGPSMTLDTACSSSMYALHLACQAIENGECVAAIVGASNLVLTPECQILSSALGTVSPTSVCHSFDIAADGYARADGVGALLVKKLSEAVRDGDPIRAVIRGTAINANGRTSGITHPSPDGQEAVIRRAYERAGLDPSLTGYFECHGTGTKVGDPIEVAAVGRVFAEGRSKDTPLLIGSIKSNMGHSEATAGIAGIMKAVIALENDLIPATVGLETLNPAIDLKDGRLEVVTENARWPDLPVRRASVNSFGYGGANAHTIIESVDSFISGYKSSQQVQTAFKPSRTNGHANPSAFDFHTYTRRSGNTKHTWNEAIHGHDRHTNGLDFDIPIPRTKYILPFSAHDEQTLRHNVAALKDSCRNWDISDVAYTLSSRRSLLSHRGYVIAEADTPWDSFSQQAISVRKRSGASTPTLGFVFTGQGAQWPQMALELMTEFPRYLQTIRALDRYIDDLEDARTWKIEDILREPVKTSRLHEAEISQPVVTAIQIALVNLLSVWEVKPKVVVGHSSGEIAAGYAAGLISDREAIIAAYLRGQGIAQNAQRGAMMAVGLTLPEAESHVKTFDGKIVIACHNSPESFTLSGDEDAIHELKQILDSESKFARLLSTGGNAYHSHHMKLLSQSYEDQLWLAISSLQPKPKAAKELDTPIFFSSVYGKAGSGEVLGPRYWRENLESPVLFSEAVGEIVRTGLINTFIEIGPHSALQGPLRQISKSRSESINFPAYLPALVRHHNGVDDILSLAGELFSQGYPVALEEVNARSSVEGIPQKGKIVVDMPHYQWQYPEETLLVENRHARDWRLRQHPRHDTLGSLIPGQSKKEPTWRNILRSKDIPWLKDHRIEKEIVFPGTGYLSMAVEAITQVIELEGRNAIDIHSYELRDISLKSALIIPEDEDRGIEVLFTLKASSPRNSTSTESCYEFVVTSIVAGNGDGDDNFVENCRGSISVTLEVEDIYPSEIVLEMSNALPNAKRISESQWYESFARVGLRYGTTFQGLSSIRAREGSNLAQGSISLNPTEKLMPGESRYVIHPAALDAAMQLAIVASHGSAATKLKRSFIPVTMQSIIVWPKAASLRDKPAISIATGSSVGIRGLSAELSLLNADHVPLLDARGFLLVTSEQQANESPRQEPYTRLVWKPDFDSLNDNIITTLFPPILLQGNAVVPVANVLALHQLIHFRATHSGLFANGSEISHLQRFLRWINDKVDGALNEPSLPAHKIVEYADSFRAEEITRLSAELNPRSSEARLTCHLYDNLDAIFAGETTGIQVALQDNRLIDMYATGQTCHEGNRRLASVIDLLAHKNPSMKILEIGAGTGSATKEILPTLQGDSPWRRYFEYKFTDITASFLAGAEETFQAYSGITYSVFDMEKPGSDQYLSAEWDLIIASNVVHATSDIRKTLVNIRSLLKPGGKMILLEITNPSLGFGLMLGTFSDFWKGDLDPHLPRVDGPSLSKAMWREVIPTAGFNGVDFFLDDYVGDNVSSTVICASAVQPAIAIPQPLDHSPQGIILVYRKASSKLASILYGHVKKCGLHADIVLLDEATIFSYDRFLFLVELEEPLFVNPSSSEWRGLQTCLKSARSALWVTKGCLMNAESPLFGMMSGVARGLRTEMNHLRIAVLDLDTQSTMSEADLCDLLVLHERKLLDAPSNSSYEVDIRLKENIPYISRIVEDETLNEDAKTKANQQVSTDTVPMSALSSIPIRLDIDRPGVLNTLYFHENARFALPLEHDHVEIEVHAAGVNNSDVAVMMGRHHSDSFGHECAGIVTRVGEGVDVIKPGERVYCVSSSKFGNYARTRASFCKKMKTNDSFEDVATMPVAFCTAIYCLMEMGRLKKGDSVLVHSATNSVGIAAIQVAQICGAASIYATVGTPEERDRVLQMRLSVEEDHILLEGSNATRSLMKRTDGKGFDIILCSGLTEKVSDMWRCAAPFGHVIQISGVRSNDTLALNVFRRNATFASFDFEALINTRPDLVASIMTKLDGFKTAGLIQPLASKVYCAADIDQAMTDTGKAQDISKVVITYDRGSELGVKFRHHPYSAKFDPEANYLLVGCLGGLGRSFSSWAVQRGARHLIYLSRSGAIKAEVKSFIESLIAQDVEVKVVKGDVANLEDVRAAVATSERPIKGVIQSALDLQESLFETMSLESFQATVKPRVTGTINLHNALGNSPLDFFVMWSSWTVMLGTATQCNYHASNAFMDAFARYRHKLGLPATALSLSLMLDIGIVSYTPEYLQNMLRNGFYGNDEDEFLQFCDASIRLPPPSSEGHVQHGIRKFYDPLSSAHLLVGCEPAGLKALQDRYPIDDMIWSRDIRLRNLVQATKLLHAGQKTAGGYENNEEGTPEERIRLKIARLLYMSLEDVDMTTPINNYGIDSMIAAELRNWLFNNFGKGISLLNLLSDTTTVKSLAEELVAAPA